ncbi:MAG TPA: XRE family transcriptional regulator [Steroidobacter sp.]|uniref:XRE family transcriptional regulator n=1 Tax=Steroidobacter sp. TaxID=1978227 RepID=UPI002ED987F8
MGKTLEEMLARLPADRRAKIEARAALLIAEEKSLRALRQARTLTQTHMAKTLGIGQDGVSKLENRSDMMLSTLRGYVEAMGGRLNLIAEFPDAPPVALSGFGSADADRVVASRPKKKPARKGRR